MEMHKELFPFKCKTPGCKTIYEMADYAEVAKLWGFIFLSTGMNHLVGITCPQCAKTTLKKLSPVARDCDIHLLEQFPTQSPYGFPIPSNLRYLVPFTPRLIHDLGLADLSYLFDKEDDLHYRTIFGLGLVANYPENYLRYAIPASDEGMIESLLEIENNLGLKVFPRIIGDRNPYFHFDQLLVFRQFKGDPQPEHVERIDGILAALVQSDEPDINVLPGAKGGRCYSKYHHMIQNDLTKDEYHRFNPLGNNIKLEQIPKVLELLETYVMERNGLLFEIDFRNRFFNKFVRSIYGELAEASTPFFDEGMPEPEWIGPEPEIIYVPAPPLEAPGATVDNATEQSEPMENPAVVPKDHPNYLVRSGQKWLVKFGNETSDFNDLIGIDYIAILLQNAEKVVKNSSIIELTNKIKSTNKNDVDPELIEKFGTTSKYSSISDVDRKDILKYIKIIENAYYSMQNEHNKSSKKYKEYEIEFEKYKNYLNKEYKIYVYIKNGIVKYKNHEIIGPEDEKVRQNIKNNIGNALKLIRIHMPRFAIHLKECLERKSYEVTYSPAKSKLHKGIKWYVRR